MLFTHPYNGICIFTYSNKGCNKKTYQLMLAYVHSSYKICLAEHSIPLPVIFVKYFFKYSFSIIYRRLKSLTYMTYKK